MHSYVLSEAADGDIEGIIRESILQWGFARAERYATELHAAFETLSQFPRMGTDIGYIREGYFRFIHESHAMFFCKTEAGIFVVRVLHHRQEPKQNL